MPIDHVHSDVVDVSIPIGNEHQGAGDDVGQLDSAFSDDQGESPCVFGLDLAANTGSVRRYSIETERDRLTSDGAPLRVASSISLPGGQLRSEEESSAHDEQDPTPRVHAHNPRTRPLPGVPHNANVLRGNPNFPVPVISASDLRRRRQR